MFNSDAPPANYVARHEADIYYISVHISSGQIVVEPKNALKALENMGNLYIEKYLTTPFVKDYSKILDEGIEAHFMGLHYAAVATLIPLVEGISRKLSEKRNVQHKHIKKTIKNLCKSCRDEVVNRKLGAYEEVESMIESFEKFAIEKLYSDSSNYPHDDNTNRNGITHAAYADSDFGAPINFYKTVAAINSLCFLSAIDSGLSWFPPNRSEASSKKAMHYSTCKKISRALLARS